MNLIEAGIICRDAGFNWGRGSWWRCEQGSVFPAMHTTVEVMYDEYIPILSFGATRGVILEWAREKTGIPTLHVFPYFNAVIMKHGWDACSLVNGEFDFNTETEIECYAKLCQWVKENSR